MVLFLLERGILVSLGLESAENIFDLDHVHDSSYPESSWKMSDNRILELEALGRRVRHLYNSILKSSTLDENEKNRMINNLKRDLNRLIEEYDLDSNKKVD